MGLDLVLCLNPLVPFDASHPARHRVLAGGEEVIPHLVDGGLPVVLSQTFRTLIHSRLELGMKGYDASHPGTDVLLFEPDHRDPAMFLANTFGYSQRRRLAEHAYQRTRADLRSRRSALQARLRPPRPGAGRRRARRHRAHAAGGTPPAAQPASARTLRRLDEVLDDLEQALPA